MKKQSCEILEKVISELHEHAIVDDYGGEGSVFQLDEARGWMEQIEAVLKIEATETEEDGAVPEEVIGLAC